MPDLVLKYDNVTRWAFLVIDPGAKPMFTVHRPGCRDLIKAVNRRVTTMAITADVPIPHAEGPDTATLAVLIRDTVYGGEADIRADHVRRMPCLVRR